jgi:hypothetical protein
MTSQPGKMHPLSILHVVAMTGLLVWWSLYFWGHTPARDLFRNDAPAQNAQHRRAAGASLGGKAAGALGARVQGAGTAVSVALADVAGGLVVLVLFAVGTGIYVRRFEIWLQARGSGETMAFAGTGLGDKTLAANSVREPRP